MATDDVNSKDVSNENEREELYWAALTGNWAGIESMENIQRKLTGKSETILHVAVAANQEIFVKKLLLNGLGQNNLSDTDILGNNALTYAAATGNVNIAKMLLGCSRDLLNRNGGVKALIMAAWSGHIQMVQFLYSETRMDLNNWGEVDQAELFIACVKSDIYGVALEMLYGDHHLAHARDPSGMSALDVLARNPSAFISGSQPGMLRSLRRCINIPWTSKIKREKLKQFQAKELFQNCLRAYKGNRENSETCSETNTELVSVLFTAAEAGNIEFLVNLIRFDFDLLYETRGNKSIFHIAVEKRHESIFGLLKEIGCIGGLIVHIRNDYGDSILDSAVKLAPQEKLNSISGAALQMQQELLWFEEVGKILSPAFKVKEDEEKSLILEKSPYDLFKENHEDLRKEGENWMRSTAENSMVVATLIGSITFSGQLADINGSNNPNLYLVFSVASAIALFCSSTSLIMFLSILTSRYSFEDFRVWLPVRLMIGVASLFISIATMMVAFSTSFLLKNPKLQEWPLIFVVIGLFASVPILYVLLKYRLFVDIVRSTFYQFKPRQRLFSEERVSYASQCTDPRSNAPANPTATSV